MAKKMQGGSSREPVDYWKTNGHPGTGGPDDVVTITPFGRYLMQGLDLDHARSLAETGCTWEELQGQLPLPLP